MPRVAGGRCWLAGGPTYGRQRGDAVLKGGECRKQRGHGRKGRERTVLPGAGNSTGKGLVAGGWVESQVGSERDSGEKMGWRLRWGLVENQGLSVWAATHTPHGEITAAELS